jgi:hypothetical protein
MAYMVEILSLDDVKNVGLKCPLRQFFSGLGLEFPLLLGLRRGTPLQALVKDKANYWPPRTFQLRGQCCKWDSSILIADQVLLLDGRFRGRGPSTPLK